MQEKIGSHLPVSRVKTIMKSSAEVDVIGSDSLLMVTRAAELFIQYLSKEAHKKSDGKKLDYNHLSKVVHETDKLDFLGEIIPKKITVREFKKRLQKLQQREQEGRSSSSEDSEDSSSSGEEEEEDEDEQSSDE